jgi:glycerol uptake facilitator-like aquaporin
VGTFVFVFFILLVTNEKTTFTTNTLSTWMCIAGALYIGRHYAIRSGGCLNPGVAIGM